MEFKDALARRRMVRNYAPEPIDRESLQRIAAAALRAPSAGNSRGVEVIVVQDPSIRRAIALLADEPHYVAKGFDPWISRAPAHVVIAASRKVYLDRYSEPDKLDRAGTPIDWPVPYWYVDAGASMMAVLLAAVDEGLAAGFFGVHRLGDLSSLLGIPDDYQPIGVVTVGKPAADRRSASLDRRHRSSEEMIHQDRWER